MFEHKIVAYRPKPPVRKPRMYLETNRECGRCGSNNTYDKIINRVQWHRETDDNGKWTGKWLCNKCYHKERRVRRNHEMDLIRKVRSKIIGN